MGPMRQGLTEWAIVTAVLVLAATAGALRYGREIRAFFGVPAPATAAAAGTAARPLALPAAPR